MRYPASEKAEIIALVEQSHLPARRTLEKLGIPRATFYRWYDRYREGGIEALADHRSKPDRVWNRIPDDVRGQIVDLALELPELSPRELAVAADQRGHPWRTPSLATVSPEGLPDARSVVLREVDPDQERLIFFTDARSPKVGQLKAQPRAMLVMWSAELGWQLRIQVACRVEASGLAVSSRMTPIDRCFPTSSGSGWTGLWSATSITC